MVYNILKSLRALVENGLSILFPVSCIGCPTIGTVLCVKCMEKIPSPHKNLPQWVHAVYSYKHPIIQKSIWHLKYKNGRAFAEIYGTVLYNILAKDNSGHSTRYIIPIPISNKRLRERGYNQTILLLGKICSLDREHLFQNGSALLVRHEKGIRQAKTQTKQERLENIRGSFQATQELDPQAMYILIDDVVTTGATLREARAALEERGASTTNITALTIAH